MSSTIFQNRLRTLNVSGRYSRKAVMQFESILSKHNGILPKVFRLKDLGVHTISNILHGLGYDSFSINAPLGAKSSIREVILD